jgi:eukaryotic-like serine/threonine-protein kinase
MDTPSWHRVKEIIEAVLARAPAERAATIQQMCGDDASLRAEAESLLTAIEQAGNFIERPAFQSQSLSAAFPAGWIPDMGQRALEPGNAFGPYTIVEFVGAGGMGEVYRARDANLNRDIALKVRPAAFALDADRFARFRREAQILAALNHPNIAAIYGLENSGDIQALVLELVEGPTLASRIGRGRIPISEALSIAKQIAEGLEAAHKRGIIHSDLKPANIKLRPDGTVKILDFGLAKALDAVDAGSAPSEPDLPTSSAISHAGLIFGTAAYMSPEQARGEAVDKRTDIWAFGCVLYETLTGRPVFLGQTIEDILAAVLNQEPDWTLLPPETPAGVARLLRRCLEKNADRRLHDVADARIEIEDAAAPALAAVPEKRRRPALLVWVGIAAMAVTVAVWGALRLGTLAPETALAVKRLQIGLPDAGSADGWSMPQGFAGLLMAISPDGTRLTYVLQRQGVSQLYLQELDKPEPTLIAGTEGAFGPFFSPDGRWIGFFAENKLKKVAITGGEPIELSAAPNAFGGSWGTDGTILFTVDEGRRPTKVSENGGIPQAITIIGRGSFRRPDILPGGKAAIVSNPLLGVGVLSLETAEFRLLVPDAGGGRYMPGHLVFARAGVLLEAPFDLKRLALTGPETVVLESVRTELEGVGPQPQAVFSREGTLVYAQGGAPRKFARPVWVDRRGKVQSLGMPPRSYRTFSLSPDGRLLALIIADPRNDVWVQDLERGTLTQRTFGAEPDAVLWTRDGKRILVGSRRNGKRVLSLPREGSGESEPFHTEDGQPGFGSFSPDGRFVATVQGDPATGLDIWVRSLKSPQISQPFLRTKFTEAGPKFSPDGRWIAYGSDESGQSEIYVRPYPGPGRKWQISTEGGVHAVWSRDGKELFYRNGPKFMSVAVNLTPEFTAATPRLLFEGPYVLVGGNSFDVSPDGQQFLVLEPVEEQIAPITHLNIVLNWFEDVKRKAAPAPPRGF